ncbi:hypothetical protein AAG906_010360 [Vitis piasezkii]
MTLSSTSFGQAEIKVDRSFYHSPRGASKQLGMSLKILGRGKTLTPHSASSLPLRISLPPYGLFTHLTSLSLSHSTPSFEQGPEAHFSIFIWQGPEGPLLILSRVALRGREPPLLRPHRFPLLRVERPLVPPLLLLSTVRRPPAKRARTSSLGESSRASQSEPPIATHARAPADSELPSNMSPRSIIRRPMLTAPPIEGNLD